MQQIINKGPQKNNKDFTKPYLGLASWYVRQHFIRMGYETVSILFSIVLIYHLN